MLMRLLKGEPFSYYQIMGKDWAKNALLRGAFLFALNDKINPF
jgi:hypothetical protein